MSTPDMPTEPPVEPSEYDEMLESLDTAITEVEYKIEDGRIRDIEKEQTRIKYYRVLAYLIRTKRQVLEDKTLDDLAEEIEALKDGDADTEANV